MLSIQVIFLLMFQFYIVQIKMTKSIQFLSLWVLLICITPSIQAQSLHEQMFKEFGEIPEQMSTVQIHSYVKESARLDQKFHSLLDELRLSSSGNEIVPLGKVAKGRNVTLLYFYVSHDEDQGDVFYLHSVTLSKKTGEKTFQSKYLMAGGARSGRKYAGSFEYKGQRELVVTESEIDLETDEETMTVKVYEFSKKGVACVRTIE